MKARNHGAHSQQQEHERIISTSIPVQVQVRVMPPRIRRVRRQLGDEKYTKRRRRKQKQNISLLLAMVIFLATFAMGILLSRHLHDVRRGSNNSAEASKSNKPWNQRSNKDLVNPVLHPHEHPHGHEHAASVKKQKLRGNSFSSFSSSWFSSGLGLDENPEKQLTALEEAMQQNHHSGRVWMHPELLVSRSRYRDDRPNPLLQQAKDRPKSRFSFHGKYFRVSRSANKTPMAWEHQENANQQIKVDYTQHNYLYPEPSPLMEPPTLPPTPPDNYPQLRPMQELMKDWPQDDIDTPPTPFRETLMHFDYTNPVELQAAEMYRDHKLPFKVTNVPELKAATHKWTDDYVANHFDGPSSHANDGIPKSTGTCQESSTSFFAFFQPNLWNIETMGLAPTRSNDFTFTKWSQHARYADAVGLDYDQPHFYWQSGVPREERMVPSSQWTFVSRDLPSFSSPSRTFFGFDPSGQKGIQCRFGERGVTAATHYDAGRNMVAMITGAKRYILSPPRECSKLGITTSRGSIFRHSLLNFGHLQFLDKDERDMGEDDADMPSLEREWLTSAGQAQAVDTVLKAGEVLYIPSHWFHYIISLQKNAQCNVRSGVDVEGDDRFGGQSDVVDHCDPF
jgi:hypothetical protein